MAPNHSRYQLLAPSATSSVFRLALRRGPVVADEIMAAGRPGLRRSARNSTGSRRSSISLRSSTARRRSESKCSYSTRQLDVIAFWNAAKTLSIYSLVDCYLSCVSFFHWKAFYVGDVNHEPTLGLGGGVLVDENMWGIFTLLFGCDCLCCSYLAWLAADFPGEDDEDAPAPEDSLKIEEGQVEKMNSIAWWTKWTLIAHLVSIALWLVYRTAVALSNPGWELAVSFTIIVMAIRVSKLAPLIKLKLSMEAVQRVQPANEESLTAKLLDTSSGFEGKRDDGKCFEPTMDLMHFYWIPDSGTQKLDFAKKLFWLVLTTAFVIKCVYIALNRPWEFGMDQNSGNATLLAASPWTPIVLSENSCGGRVGAGTGVGCTVAAALGPEAAPFGCGIGFMCSVVAGC